MSSHIVIVSMTLFAMLERVAGGKRDRKPRRLAHKEDPHFLNLFDVKQRGAHLKNEVETRKVDTGVLSRLPKSGSLKGSAALSSDLWPSAAGDQHVFAHPMAAHYCGAGNYVVCEYGFYVNSTTGVVNSTLPCDTACDGQCCVGSTFTQSTPGGIITYYGGACSDYYTTLPGLGKLGRGFTGTVCKDGISCMDFRACYEAKIGLVHMGCSGTNACQYAGCQEDRDPSSENCTGYVGVISNSCLKGDCGKAGGYYGHIGKISNSCKADYAGCIKAAYGHG